MRRTPSFNWRLSEISISLVVLAVLLVFSYGIFVEAPYSGFYFDPANGRILQIYVDVDPEDSLREGDTLEQIGQVAWASYKEDRSRMLFEGVRSNQTVDLIVQRGNQSVTVAWMFPGLNRNEFLARFINVWWLAFVFWVFGMLIQLFVRPKDTRWRLLIAADYLTAIWLIAGSLSAFHMWGSSVILHAVTWLMLPVYLHLHWVFPKSLGRVPTWAVNIFYLVGGALTLGEMLQWFPRSFYVLGFLLALVGSVVLLIVHFVRRPVERRTVRLLLVSILLALFPSISLSIAGISQRLPQFGPLALLALPLMPGAYFYVVFRRQLGGLEVRTNRLISAYVFLILVGTILLMLIAPAMLFSFSPSALVFLALLLAGLAAVVSIWAFPPFQSFIEQRFLNVKLPYQHLLETYSARITTSASLASLVTFLKDEVLPSLFVRQFAFLQADNHILKELLTVGIVTSQLPGQNDYQPLRELSGRYRSPENLDSGQFLPWVNLALPLKLDHQLIGFWLFGRRDPDDFYSHTEIPVLQSLADQTAIALSNIFQTERLRTIYLANINRYEEERLLLALDLHDSILNQLAVLQMNLEQPSEKFQDAYDGLTKRLREIVSNLRPPMLNYGLDAAIRELAENLMERSQDTVQIDVDLPTDGTRFPSKVELHLFRIVQEACENALRHARAKKITVFGTLLFREINLNLEDDGIGFDVEDNLQLDILIANKHFGLAGMIERAAIVGAEVGIESRPGNGTKIQICWRPAQA